MKKHPRLAFTFWALLMALILAFAPQCARAQDPRLPKPDFSEMEKDYEIIKWTYEPSGYIRLVMKPKHDGPHDTKYGFKFFDADGVTVDGPKTIFNNGYSTPAGEVERGEAYAPDEGGMRKVKSVIVYKILGDGTLIGPKPSESMPMPETPKKNPAAPTRPHPAPGGEKPAKTPTTGENSAECSFEKQPPSSSAMKYSLPLIKSLLYERYSFEKETGGLSSPLDIGVKFLDIKLLGSYTNTVTVVPGRGAQRKHDGAPVNATVYRFHAKYIVCRKYSDTIRRTQYESDFACFKAKNGAWDCPVDSVPQITELH